MNSRMKIFSAAAFALLLLAACGSTGGNIFGNNNPTHLRGTVDSVDTANRLIYLVNAYSDNGSMLSSGGSSGNSLRVAYDNNTTVQYQGRTYRPQDLERGDQIDVNTNGSSNNLYASSITVTSDVRTSGNYPNSGTYPNNGYPTNGSYTTLHGTVRSIDTGRQTVMLDPGNGSYITVQYNSSTPVYFNGQTYQPGNLEIGDQVDVRGQNVNNGLFSAQDMTVTYSVSSNGTVNNGTYGTSTATLRGTVNYVDTANHTIQLTQTNWVTGFDRSVGSNGSTITIGYNPNAQVNVNGQMYAVTGLQRGDIVDLQLQNLGGSNYVANGITLIHDVNARY